MGEVKGDLGVWTYSTRSGSKENEGEEEIKSREETAKTRAEERNVQRGQTEIRPHVETESTRDSTEERGGGVGCGCFLLSILISAHTHTHLPLSSRIPATL